jgi:hypothetical protein
VSVSLPTPLDQLRNCPFSFYPPIVNIEHNEWLYARATWTEIQVINTKTSTELWVPRRFVGEVSLVGDPVMIVGLLKELEYKEGVVAPHVRRVIEMPRAVNDSPRPPAQRSTGEDRRPQRPADVVGIRIETPRESRTGRMVFGTVAAGLLAFVAVELVRDATLGSRLVPSAAAHIDLPLTADDDYDSVTSKLGAPGKDQWRSAGQRDSSSEIQYRRLWYPRRGFAVILIDGRYAGALDGSGHVLHSVVSPALLKKLR